GAGQEVVRVRRRGLEERAHHEDLAAEAAARIEQGGGRVQQPDAPGTPPHEIEQRRIAPTGRRGPERTAGCTVSRHHLRLWCATEEVAAEDARLGLEPGVAHRLLRSQSPKRWLYL